MFFFTTEKYERMRFFVILTSIFILESPSQFGLILSGIGGIVTWGRGERYDCSIS